MNHRVFFYPRILLVLLAIFDSAYLFLIEQGLASCSVLGESTCVTVLPVYSEHLLIPLPILGFIGYFMLLLFTIFASKHPKLLFLRRFSAFFAFIFSIYLMSYMFLIVQNLCAFCVISFILVVAFAVLEFLELDRRRMHRITPVIILLSFVVLAGVFLVSREYKPREIFAQKSAEFLANVKVLSNDYREIMRKSEKPLLVYIYSTKCEFCQYYVAEVLSCAEVEKALTSFKFYRINVAEYNTFMKSIETKVKSVPALVIWSQNKGLQILAGVRKKDAILKFTQQ